MRLGVILFLAAAVMILTGKPFLTALATEIKFNETDYLADSSGTEGSETEESGYDEPVWETYQLMVDDDVYSFPMMFTEFSSFGWKSDEIEDVTVFPYNYYEARCVRDQESCLIYLLNLGINTVRAGDCIVAGIEIEKDSFETEDSEILLPGGLTAGISGADDILSVYGAPDEIYSGDTFIRYTYKEDYNKRIQLQVSLESGVINDIKIENFTEPEGYDYGELCTEEPSRVLAYVKPETLSSDLSSYEIDVDGEVYELPVPVSVLIDDGWELNSDNSDMLIYARYYGQVTLQKNNVSFSARVVNGEDYGTIPENCWLESFDLEISLDLDGSLPGDVKIGTGEDEFVELLETNGMIYDYYESEDYHYYTYNAPSYGKGCSVTVYVGEDSIYEKDTIIEVHCENALE